MNRWEHWIEADKLAAEATSAFETNQLEDARVLASIATVHAVLATGQVPTITDEPAPAPARRGLGLAHPLPGGGRSVPQ